jgi:peptide/nickel transport system ATP-binding protein
LNTTFGRGGVAVEAVKNVSFELHRGEILGIVGESGSGKSTMLMSILRLLPPNAESTARSIRFRDSELTSLTGEQMRRLRGGGLSLIPQRPQNALSPVTPIGTQIRRFLADDPSATGGESAAIREMLTEVGLGPVVDRLRGYPHEFSGGQMQRLLIAIATLAARPEIVFADEPTSTLDVTVQGQVLRLIGEVRNRLGLSVILVTHDLGVVAQVCDRVGVMYAGELIELTDVVNLFENPRHPYTRALLDAVPSRHKRGERLPGLGAPPAPRPRTKVRTTRPERVEPRAHPRIQVEEVERYFELRKGVFGNASNVLRAVDGVSLSVAAGETMALVGESGCGKSTIARLLLRLDHPTRGRLYVDGRDIGTTDGLRYMRDNVQVVSQNPHSSLNRRRTIRQALMAPINAHRIGGTRAEKVARVRELLELVGLSDIHLDRYPSELSVGQLQRVAVARALAVEPEVLVLDEPTASLDVSVKAVIVNLLMDLRRELNLTYLWITHEIDIANHVSDRIAVMYLGRIAETGPTVEVLAHPRHPYTKALLASVPVADPRQRTAFTPLGGEVPSPINPPEGCAFHTRCAFAVAGTCDKIRPELRLIADEQFASCHFAEELAEATSPRK